ncbi:hypothetical protein H0H92_005881 [Tricholoma furcatifolium]|nr:hypothetical protein H0H92_005881 [Tricholoma furcatifolium]
MASSGLRDKADIEPLMTHLSVLGKSPSISTQVNVIGRCHVNVLGVSEVIENFASIKELLGCLRRCVQDHESAYKKLYLQRDISMGNLLVFDDPGTAGDTFGRLVDYDHAKKAAGWIDIARPGEKLKDMARYADMASTVLAYEPDSRWQVEAAVAQEAVACVAHPGIAGYYLVDVIKNDSSLAEKAATSPLSMDDLHWTETQTKPDFESRSARQGERTGSLAYMSAEVLTGNKIAGLGYVWDLSGPKFTQDAIHDMESLLWVLVHLCMIRKGPGMDMTRDELLDLDNPTTLHDALINYFDGNKGTLREEKTQLLWNPLGFEEQVVSHFHPYFRSLRSLARKWWSILILGYKYRAKEFYNIHAYLARILDQAIQELPESTDDEDTKKGLKDREHGALPAFLQEV